MSKYKTYWYCDIHDDAYYMNDNDIKNLFEYDTKIICCQSKIRCDLFYIGYKEYDGLGKLIKEDLPSEEWFGRRGGGFKKKYLDQVEVIRLDFKLNRKY